MKTHLNITAICTAALLYGCAQFQHQTREDEPHAIVTIVRPSTSAPQSCMAKSMDGQPVREGASYRVRPGSHEIVIEMVERDVETAGPMTATLFHSGNGPMELAPPGNVHFSESGAVTASGLQPYTPMQAVTMSVEKRSIRQQTRQLEAVANRRYEINGSMITEVPLQKR
jgi:hypothetical protein